jgi:hypothetical protein
MKKSDWALVILVVAVVGVISYFVIDSILPAPTADTVVTAPPIVANIDAPKNDVILYDADKPNWCQDGTSSNGEAASESDNNGDNADTTAVDNNDNSDSTVEANSDGKQAINSVFNSCAINSSFVTITGGDPSPVIPAE